MTLNPKCSVPGCSGHINFHTDGEGRVREWCYACEERVNEVAALRAAIARAARYVDTEWPGYIIQP